MNKKYNVKDYQLNKIDESTYNQVKEVQDFSFWKKMKFWDKYKGKDLINGNFLIYIEPDNTIKVYDNVKHGILKKEFIEIGGSKVETKHILTNEKLLRYKNKDNKKMYYGWIAYAEDFNTYPVQPLFDAKQVAKIQTNTILNYRDKDKENSLNKQWWEDSNVLTFGLVGIIIVGVFAFQYFRG